MQGKRKRTVYDITPAGRRALRKGMRDESAPPVFESEALLRTEGLYHFQLAAQLFAEHLELISRWSRTAREQIDRWPTEWSDEDRAAALRSFGSPSGPRLN